MSASVSQLELTKPLTPDSPPPPPAVDLNDQPELVIKPRKGWIAVDWRELWNYRELLYFLVWRDVKVRYKQAILGIAWAVLAPLMSVMVFTLIFGSRGLGSNVHLPPDLQAHSALFIFAGLIPWLFLSQAISNGGMALVNSQHMLTKIYLPRLFIPASTIGSTMVDMLIAFGVFCLMMLFTGYTPSPLIVLLPLVVLLTVLLALGMAFALSAMTVTYRDLRFLIPFITQIGMWISAVVFPYKGVGALAKHEWVLLFNPFFGIIDTFRTCLFGAGPDQWGWRPWHLLASIVWTIAILAFGLFYFRKTERRFADIA